MSDKNMPLLRVRDLHVRYHKAGLFRKDPGLMAVDGINLDIHRGQTLGLVGESGSGKSSTARAIMRLIDSHSGSIFLDNCNVLALTNNELKKQLYTRVQMVFQDPYGSLNPRMRIQHILAEPLRNFGSKTPAQEARIAELLSLVGLDPSFAERYPHECSGGQRQRVGIARALAPNPELLVCDEPVSALDVSVQAQIINLLRELQERLGLSMLVIAHDLAVVRLLAQDIAIMRSGKIVEHGSRDKIYQNAEHPYTQQLLAAVPEVPR